MKQLPLENKSADFTFLSTLYLKRLRRLQNIEHDPSMHMAYLWDKRRVFIIDEIIRHGSVGKIEHIY